MLTGNLWWGFMCYWFNSCNSSVWTFSYEHAGGRSEASGKGEKRWLPHELPQRLLQSRREAGASPSHPLQAVHSNEMRSKRPWTPCPWPPPTAPPSLPPPTCPGLFFAFWLFCIVIHPLKRQNSGENMFVLMGLQLSLPKE